MWASVSQRLRRRCNIIYGFGWRRSILRIREEQVPVPSFSCQSSVFSFRLLFLPFSSPARVNENGLLLYFLPAFSCLMLPLPGELQGLRLHRTQTVPNTLRQRKWQRPERAPA